MDFVDRIRKLADRLSQLKPHIHTEQATQQALILPLSGSWGMTSTTRPRWFPNLLLM